MPDIGVLELQIHDDSEQSAQGLDKIADALFRVKRAVKDGLKLSGVARQLSKIADVVNNEINSTTISRLKDFGDAMARLKGLGDIKINIKTSDSFKNATDAINNAKDAFNGINTGFEEFGQRTYEARNNIEGFNETMRDMNGLINNTNWSGGLHQFREMMEAMSRMQSAFTLGPGEQTGLSTEVENGWTQWKNGAIEVEGTVTDAMETINARLGEPILYLTSIREQTGTIGDYLDTAASYADRFARSLDNCAQAAGQLFLTAGKMPLLLGDGSDYKPDWSFVDTMGQMYQRMGEMADEYGWFGKEGKMLPAGEEPLRLYGDVEASIDGVRTAAQAIEHVHEAAQEAGPSLEDFYHSLNKLDLLRNLRDLLTAKLGKGMFDGIMSDETILNYQIRIANLTEQIDKLAAAEQGASREALEMARSRVNSLMDSNELELNQVKLDAMTDALVRQYAAGKLNDAQLVEKIKTLQNLREKIDQLREAEEKAASLSGRLAAAFAPIGTGIKNLFEPIGKLIGRFRQIAKYRMLRAVLKHITEGFSEGVQNVYEYSKAVGGDFATSMNDAATVLAQFKNSIGAAAAPLIQALIPALNAVVNAVIEGINWFNQFLSLITGNTTWIKALSVPTEAFSKQTKAAKGAGKAVKDLLADWDELNIIQSESSGGSGSGKKTSLDYKNMFEEVDQFAESARSVLSFIDNYLGGLEGTLKKLGAVILGWKLSKAFSGVLGNIGKLLAGGAILVLGIELSYGGGFEAGKKGYFDGADLIATIGGTLAAAIGGSLITSGFGLGGGIGFAIGLGVGIIATAVGWIEGQADLFDKLRWGSNEMTPEQIKDYVSSRFSFNIESEINLLEANIQDRETAKQELETKINSFIKTLNLARAKVKLRADDAETSIKDAYESSKGVISQIQSYIDLNHDALVTTFSISPPMDGQGNEITDNVLSQLTIADKTLKEYFTDIGKELADAMYQGEKDGWTEGEMETVLALMEHQRNIVAKAEEMQRDLTFEMNYRFQLNNLTRDNAKDIFEQEKQLIDEYKQKFMQDRETAKEAAIKQLSWTEAAIEDYRKKGKDTSELEKTAAIYRGIIEDYLDPEKAEEAWKLKMTESMATLRQDWIYALQKNGYGISEAEAFARSTFMQKYLGSYKSPGTELADSLFDAAKAKDPVGEAQKALQLYFDTIKREQPSYVQEMMDTLNLNVWDIADDTIKQNLIRVLRDAVGDDYAAAALQNMQVPIDEIERLFGEGYKFNPGMLSPKEFVAENYPLMDFTGLGYKAPEVQPVMDGSELIQGAEDTVEQTKEILSILDGDKIHIEPDVKLSKNAQTALQMVENAVNSGKGIGEIQAASAQAIDMFGVDAFLEAQPYINQLMETYRKMEESPLSVASPDISAFTNAFTDMRKDALNTFTFISTLYSGLSLGSSSGFFGAVGSVIQGLFNPTHRAMGGPVRSGDLVMANENGNFEMMGRMGNQPVVANNQQIVNGITQGVATANGNVVSELSTLSNLMRQLLQKELVAKVVPSSSMGRSNQMSAEAYSRVTG